MFWNISATHSLSFLLILVLTNGFIDEKFN